MIAVPIGVLIVDDSAVVRQHLTARMRDAGIDVLAAVADPILAMERMSRSWPDVIVVDLESPRGDGVAFVQRIMAVRPTPVILCVTGSGGSTGSSAARLAADAAYVIRKPASGLKAFIEHRSGEIVEAVRAAAASARRSSHRSAAPPPPGRAIRAPAAERVIAIGTSAGGTRALEVVLPALPHGVPGVVIVQHMPEHFTTAFADRLDAICRLQVREAADGDEVLPGRVLVAPGGRHTELVRVGSGYRVRVFDAPPVNRHRPSVDVLFRSAARVAGADALGVIMTGMGDDGARGLLEMRQAGAFTVAQDEASCVVHGMPYEAVQLGAVHREAPLNGIAEIIHRHG